MRTIDTYRKTLEQILEQIKEKGFSGTHRMIVSEDQLAILDLLHAELTISLKSSQSYAEYSDMTGTDNEGNVTDHVEPFEGHLVTYVLNTDPGEITTVTGRLEALQSWQTQHPGFLGDSSDREGGNDGRAIVLASHGGFTYFGDGLITFNGKILALQRQQA